MESDTYKNNYIKEYLMRKQSATQSWEESYKLGQKSLKNKNLKDA